jgi:hypothetical protein
VRSSASLTLRPGYTHRTRKPPDRFVTHFAFSASVPPFFGPARFPVARIGLTIHRRSLERVLHGKKIAAPVMEAPRQRDVADYETLRSTAMLSGPNHSDALLPRGLAAWLTAMSPQPLQRLPSEPRR